MINKRLIKVAPQAMPHVAKNVILQLLGLISNIVLMITISSFIGDLTLKTMQASNFLHYALVIASCICIKVCTVYYASAQSYLVSKSIKNLLRCKIFDKVIKLGSKYTKICHLQNYYKSQSKEWISLKLTSAIFYHNSSIL